MKYRRAPGNVLHKGNREVLAWQDEVHFRCPCGHRSVFVAAPPHGIAFDDDGLLTISGSCGYAGNDEHPANWCHFHITNGVPEMCAGAQCPGAERVTGP